MVLTPKMMRSLTGYWERKFNSKPGSKVDAAGLLAKPSDAAL